MNKVRPVWLLTIIALGFALLIFLTNDKVSDVHTQEKNNLARQGNSLYVPSPYELTFMLSSKEVWPRRYSIKHAPQVSDIPNIYTLFRKLEPANKDEIDFFRSVAISSNLGEWPAFRDILSFKLRFRGSSEVTPSKLLEWIRGEKCSTFGNEMSYRLIIWESKMLEPIKSIAEKCDPTSFHALWYRIVYAEQKKDTAALKTLRDEIQARREHLPNESYEYFLLTQVFTAVDLQLAHQSVSR